MGGRRWRHYEPHLYSFRVNVVTRSHSLSSSSTMSSAIQMPERATPSAEDAQRSVVTVSPYSPSTSLHDRFHAPTSLRNPLVLHPSQNENLRILVLENISMEAVKAFTKQGFLVDHHKKAMSEDELVKIIPTYNAIGIRSKTKITERVIRAARKVCLNLSTSTSDTNNNDLRSSWL